MPKHNEIVKSAVLILGIEEAIFFVIKIALHKNYFCWKHENFPIGMVFVKWVIQLSHNFVLFSYECMVVAAAFSWSVQIKL